MMRNNDNKQPDELERQQQLQQQQPTLPLMYLPIELVEEISLYFDEWTAFDPLTVSRFFYSLFLPRIWADLHTFNDIEDDEMRLHMLEKYGHFVRRISFISYIKNWFNFDWLPFVKHATSLRADIRYEDTAEEVGMLMKSVKQLKMLQTLDLHFMAYGAGVKLDELAAGINGLGHLKCITCEFENEYGARKEGGEWKRAIGFVDLLCPLKRSKLRLKMKIKTGFNGVDVRALAPYIVKLESYENHLCTAYLIHEFFGIRDKDGQPLVFPQLKELSMTACCFNSEDYTVESITASRFSQLQHLHFYSGSCDLLARGRPNIDEYERYNWKPEYSGYSHIIVPSQRWNCLTRLCIGIVSSSILVDIIGFNTQLQQLDVGTIWSKVPKENDPSKYNHDQFQLDVILDRLPHLVEFSIGRLNSRIVVSPAALPVTRRYAINITIGCQMSIAPSATAYILQMPQLTNITLNECVLVDVDETIQLLQGNAATCGVKRFDWTPIEWHQDLALAVTEKMPQLEWFTGRKCPKEHRAVFEAKYEFYY
ncbi:hypothetical protein GQ42DRAFT_5888 [Ramicandelaber brevisporus]|nr:hypothetical protein GQ42DRAFT_5888 [Ramicandelaber brevisporus]